MKHITITGSYTDFYEITMAQAYFLEGKKDTSACFDYFFRKLPFGGGYVVFAGLQDFLDIISNLAFTEDEIEFFRTKNFHPLFIEYLKNFKFTGSVYSVNEGDLIFPNLPVLRVEGNIIETQIIETLLLNYIN
jgi:nicotinate phosphoribosyltransferase